MDKDERIRLRAYELWQSEGCPQGRQDEHWARAALEIEDEDRAREALGAAPLSPPTEEDLEPSDAPSDRSLAQAAEALRDLDDAQPDGQGDESAGAASEEEAAATGKSRRRKARQQADTGPTTG